MSDPSLATLGHNSNSIDLALVLDPEQLLADLKAGTTELFTRRDELVTAFERFQTATANGLADDEAAGKAGDFVRMLGDLLKTADTRRTTIKAPVLEAQRVIDNFFKRDLADPVDAAKRAVSASISSYVAARERAEREARQAAAEAQRREAQRLAEEAERTQNAATMDRALDAEARAEQTAAAPVAPPPVRSGLGTTVSSRKGPIKMRVTDIDKVPRAYLVPSEPMLLGYAKAHAAAIDAGQQPIPGVEFYREVTANIR